MPSRNLDIILLSDFNIGDEGVERVTTLSVTAPLTLVPRTLYIVEVGATDVTLTVNNAGNTGAYAYFYAKKTGVGNVYIESASLINGLASQPILVDDEGFGMKDASTTYRITGEDRTTVDKYQFLNGQIADPADPTVGNSVIWTSDGTGSGNAGDLMMKVNVASVVTTITLSAKDGFDHASLINILSAGVGVITGGHITNGAQGIAGFKTFLEQLAVSATPPSEEALLNLISTNGDSFIRYESATTHWHVGLQDETYGTGQDYVFIDAGESERLWIGRSGVRGLGIQGEGDESSLRVNGTVKITAGKVLNNQTGTSYTFVIGDAGKACTANNAAAQNFDIPANSSVVYNVGAEIFLENVGSGVVTLRDKDLVTRATLAASGLVNERIIARNLGSDNWSITKY